MRSEPRCPECGWMLEFVPMMGHWSARCWNPSCQRSKVVPREAVTHPAHERRTHKRVADWEDKLHDDRRIT